ncbi:MAG: histidine phosphatase family protein [Proteobacteria bacterium]|nr:histidine phosphatase family protein [Pseudomonadota bacterium]
MKTIILVRHAKSSWEDLSLDDFDRPLSKRGKKNAPFIGKKLKERQIMPDLVLSSPAKRARKTATAIAKVIGYPKKKIIFEDNMYHASARYLLEMVRKLDDKHETIMLFGHNPDFNDLADMLLKKNPVHNIVTTGVHCIKLNVDQWQKVREGKGESVFYDYPKRYQAE